METSDNTKDKLNDLYEQIQAERRRYAELWHIYQKLTREKFLVTGEERQAKIAEQTAAHFALTKSSVNITDLQAEYRQMMPEIILQRLEVLLDAMDAGGWDAHRLNVPSPLVMKKLVKKIKRQKRRLKAKGNDAI